MQFEFAVYEFHLLSPVMFSFTFSFLLCILYAKYMLRWPWWSKNMVCLFFVGHLCIYYLLHKYITSHFQDISSKNQQNLKNYGSFVNSFEFVSDLDQPGPCNFIRLEMAALWSQLVQIGNTKKNWFVFPALSEVSIINISPRKLNQILKIMGSS